MHNSNSSGLHQPVLVREVIQNLKIESGKQYIDATLGDGGHAREIIKRGGWLLGIDRDKRQVDRAKKRLRRDDSLDSREDKNQLVPAKLNKPFLITGNFANLKAISKANGFTEPYGILFDLGVSSYQLDSADIGISFGINSSLDMRLDDQQPCTAQELLNSLSEEKLYEIFTRNSQEQLARPIAKAIVDARRIKPLETTAELVEIIEKVKKKKIKDKLHPATKVFLALRIEVNQEIKNLNQGLREALEILQSHGRLLVISFHETEDRLVKNFVKKHSQDGDLINLTKKPITPSFDEINQNPRSRSAKLRVAEKK